MAKILIAGIGGGKKNNNGEYNKATYEIDGKLYKDRTFISSVLEEHFNIDKTIHIGTTGSMWDNLYQHYCNKYSIEEDIEYYMSLSEQISTSSKDTNLSNLNIEKFNAIFEDKVIIKLTKYGLDETEIFENFNIIMDIDKYLNDGDEVYIDITHSFRSNAMWMFLVINYIKDVINKNIEIKMISYGMFELSGTNNGKTPIIDLNAFYKLLKWIKGAQSLKEYGNFYPLQELIEDQEVKKKMLNFSDAMNLNYIGSIKQSIQSLKRENIIAKIEKLEGPSKLLIPNIVKEFIKEFKDAEEDYEIQLKLAKWHYLQKRYAMSFININEAIKNYVSYSLKISIDNKDITSDWLFKTRRKMENDKRYKNSIDRKFDDKRYQPIKDLVNIFDTSRKVRNRIAHSDDVDSSAKNHIDNLENYCNKLERIMTKDNVRILEDFENEFNILKK
nr:TIGR02221 family CRISPR-associated protein [Fusobacterium gastrosuis]